MQVGLVLDSVFEEHDTGPGHPECAARLREVRRGIAEAGLDQRCTRVQPEAADDEQLAAVHDKDYIVRVTEACARGEHHVDSMDVAVCPESARVARLAAGSVIALCRGVADGTFDRGFAAVRPPGHHAEHALAMGFCLFNNVAVAARAITRELGLSRVLILDWDVHHGNGSQHLFEDVADVFYYSSHQHPLYPGTGLRSETGRGAGKGTTLNVPLPAGAGDDAFLAGLRDELVPAMARFDPDFVLLSAGFDAHRDDPLGGLTVSTEAFAEATEIVLGIADRHASGRIVSVLEGGYDLGALSASIVTHLQTLCGPG